MRRARSATTASISAWDRRTVGAGVDGVSAMPRRYPVCDVGVERRGRRTKVEGAQTTQAPVFARGGFRAGLLAGGAGGRLARRLKNELRRHPRRLALRVSDDRGETLRFPRQRGGPVWAHHP